MFVQMHAAMLLGIPESEISEMLEHHEVSIWPAMSEEQKQMHVEFTRKIRDLLKGRPRDMPERLSKVDRLVKGAKMGQMHYETLNHAIGMYARYLRRMIYEGKITSTHDAEFMLDLARGVARGKILHSKQYRDAKAARTIDVLQRV